MRAATNPSRFLLISYHSFVVYLIENNADCHVILGGDFNVDFSRDRLNTALLNSFCDHMGLNPIIRHSVYM